MNVPTVLNCLVKTNPRFCWPEVQIPSGTQFVALHVPDVDECGPLTQSHSRVVPTVIVLTKLPLTESTKLIPSPAPTDTM